MSARVFSPGRGTTTSDSPAPARVQRRRTRDWRLPPNTVIVDRTSRWGNPFTVADAAEAGYEDPHKAAVTEFDTWLSGDDPIHQDVYEINRRSFDRRWMRRHLHELAGRNLCCPCPPDTPCHADVLLRLANTSRTEVPA
jgi:hypothetical protein